MTRYSHVLAVCLFLIPVLGHADEITDALQSAQSAYADGDIQYAIEELDFARQRLLALKTDALSAYLPPAPDGWQRQLNSEMNAGLAMMGGGVGAEATYVSATGSAQYTLRLMADNPMIASIAGMVANAAVMGLPIERIGRQKFIVQGGEVTGIVANRILIQANGADATTLLGALEQIDFRTLGKFGAP